MLTNVITKNNGRVFVCGDIHGEINKFYHKLDDVDFDYAKDLVICTGDLVDRGPHSLDTFNLIYKSWFRTVRGNHEQFCLDRMIGGTPEDRMGYAEMHVNNGGLWFDQLPYDTQMVIAKEVQNLPVALTLNLDGKQFGFVHGDIHQTIKSWDELIAGLNGVSYRLYMNSCLWGRTRIKQHNMAIIEGVEKVYIGHTVIQQSVTMGNLHYIDTGATFGDYGYGELTILEVK